MQAREGRGRTGFRLVGFGGGRAPSAAAVWPGDRRGGGAVGLVLGPSAALCGPFLGRCALAGGAVGAVWRALSGPPRGRLGPGLCTLWLLVGTPLAIAPGLAFSRAEHGRPCSGVAKYIFYMWCLLTMLCVCVDFCGLSAWCGCWFVVCVGRFVCRFLNVCPFGNKAVAGSGKEGP